MRPRQFAPVALILALTVAGFMGARLLGERDARRDSERRAEVAAAQVRGRVEQGASLAESLRRFMGGVAGSGVTSQEFESNASRWLSPAGFPAAAWAEQVPASQRGTYERRIAHPIVTRDRRGRIAQVGSRASYLPATLVSGIPPMAVPGIDLGGETGMAAALARASALPDARATPLATRRDGTKGLFLIIFAPRVTGGVVQPGFVVVFVSDLSLRAAATEALQLTAGGSSTGAHAGGATVRRSFMEAGQRFDVAVPQGSIQGAAAVLPWLILGAGLVLAGLAGALGVNAARRATAQDELDRIFTLSPDLITVADFDGRFTRVNPAVEQVLGYTEAELLAHPYLGLVHPDDRERTAAEAAAIGQGKTTVSFENRFVRKDGSPRVLEWTTTPVVEDRLMYGVARDVTERREAETELERLAGEQAALRRVATLVATGVPAAEVFSAVAEELERLFDAQATTIARLEPDGTLAIVASSGTARDEMPVGSRLKSQSGMVLARVIRTGRSARVDDYGNAAGELTRRTGIRCSVAVPIMVEGSLWGSMGAGTEREQFPADAEQRVAEFTELVATAISNIQAREDLAASRARIVAAADEERRRVVRDLHDGAQQRLVHTIITLKLAHRELQPNQEPASELMSEALEHAERANVELRELAHGILPAVLTHGGLRAAVGALASRAPVPVEVDVSVDRLPAPFEATAYFVVAESLTNVAKHARATGATVQAHVEGGSLQLHVRDDGVGGARPDGSGFLGLADRLAVLHGQLRVESPADGGTLVAADIPLPSV
ncbi:MAG: two-component system sensor kinase [Solirubrobacterales bacterium]|nr:two-component system sensor kinase [Solirubrobacterales bacterium]